MPKGLREVVGSSVERLYLASLIAVGRQDHNRDAGELADPFADVKPVEIGQSQVQNDQIRAGQSHLCDGIGPRHRGHDLIAPRRETDTERLYQ